MSAHGEEFDPGCFGRCIWHNSARRVCVEKCMWVGGWERENKEKTDYKSPSCDLFPTHFLFLYYYHKICFRNKPYYNFFYEFKLAANCYRSEEKHSQSKLHPHIQTLTFTSRRNRPHQLSYKWNKDGCVFLGDLIKTCPGHQTFTLRNQRRKIIYFSMLIFLMALNISFIICKIYWLYLLHSSNPIVDLPGCSGAHSSRHSNWKFSFHPH